MSTLNTHVLSYAFTSSSSEDLMNFLKEADNSINYREDNLIILCDTSSDSSSYNYVIYNSDDNAYTYSNAYELVDRKPLTNYFWPQHRTKNISTSDPTVYNQSQRDILEWNNARNINTYKYHKYNYVNNGEQDLTYLPVDNFDNEMSSIAESKFDIYAQINTSLSDIHSSNPGGITLSEIKNQLSNGNIQFNKSEKFPNLKGIAKSSTRISYWRI